MSMVYRNAAVPLEVERVGERGARDRGRDRFTRIRTVPLQSIEYHLRLTRDDDSDRGKNRGYSDWMQMD